MKLKMIIFIGILTSIFFQSCTKETENQVATTNYTTEELLNQDDWKMTLYVITIFGDTYQYDEADSDPCELDDRLMLSMDNKIILELGSIKCDSNEVQTMERGTWSLMEDDSMLVLTDNFPNNSFDVFAGVFNDPTVQFEIVSLTAQKMVIKNTEFNQTFATEVISVYTFTH